MTPNEVIYYINQEKEFLEIWKKFSREEKEEVLRRAKDVNSLELEKILLEVKTGQNRLF